MYVFYITLTPPSSRSAFTAGVKVLQNISVPPLRVTETSCCRCPATSPTESSTQHAGKSCFFTKPCILIGSILAVYLQRFMVTAACVADPLSQGEAHGTGRLPRVPSGAVLPDEGQGQLDAVGDGLVNAGTPVNGQADSQILADGQADRQTDADRPADGQTDRQLQPVNGQTKRRPEPTAPRRKSLGDLTKSARRLLPVSFRQRPLQQQCQGQTEGQPDGQSTRQPSGQLSRQADGQTNGQSSMPVNGPSQGRCSPGSTAGVYAVCMECGMVTSQFQPCVPCATCVEFMYGKLGPCKFPRPSTNLPHPQMPAHWSPHESMHSCTKL